MWASASASSGPMWTNCEERQHAVQPSHGTRDACSPASAPRSSSIHDERSPAGRSSVPMVRPYRARGGFRGAMIVGVPALGDEDGLVGRGPERERLVARLDRALAGACQVALLVGEAGIGKSRLADDLA